jgi:hypothetical protein
MSESIPIEEAFEYYLRNFLQWLEVLTLDAAQRCVLWNNYNLACELVSDVEIDGSAIVELSCSYLTDKQKSDVRSFLAEIKNIPEPLLVFGASRASHVEAISHPFWEHFRANAATLLQKLAPAAAKNQEYFASL